MSINKLRFDFNEKINVDFLQTMFNMYIAKNKNFLFDIFLPRSQVYFKYESGTFNIKAKCENKIMNPGVFKRLNFNSLIQEHFPDALYNDCSVTFSITDCKIVWDILFQSIKEINKVDKLIKFI